MLLPVIIKNNCFITHTFYPNKSDKGTLYQRIEYTVNNNTTHQVSACTITKGDVAPTNFYQDIGIILKNAVVPYCCKTGAATYIEKGKLFADPEMGGHHVPTPAQMDDAIVNRQGCNEFRLTNYEVIGIFIAEPPYCKGVKILPNGDSFIDFNKNTIGLGLEYYKLIGGELYKAEFDGSEYIATGKMSISTLYK